LLRGIFDKETRRKAVAVVGAAMELRARFGLGEPTEWSGSDRRERVLCEVDVGGTGKFATCMRVETRDEAAILRLERSWPKTCQHTFESD
jgi:hypothetical protein